VARLLAYVTGLVNQELLLQVEFLVAENQILRARAPGRLRLSTEERSTLAEIGRRLGRKGLEKVALVAAKPDSSTLLSVNGSTERYVPSAHVRFCDQARYPLLHCWRWREGDQSFGRGPARQESDRFQISAIRRCTHHS
jgi:hypothetical protein